MTIYFDTSVLISLYLAEPLSAKARAKVDQYGRQLLVNQLQEMEFKNSIRQKVFRGEFPESIAIRCLRLFDDDCVLGKIQRKPIFWNSVYEKAEKISHRVAIQHYCRSFDLIHVAVAVLSGVNQFATFDNAQGEIARAAGLPLCDF